MSIWIPVFSSIVFFPVHTHCLAGSVSAASTKACNFLRDGYHILTFHRVPWDQQLINYKSNQDTLRSAIDALRSSFSLLKIYSSLSWVWGCWLWQADAEATFSFTIRKAMDSSHAHLQIRYYGHVGHTDTWNVNGQSMLSKENPMAHFSTYIYLIRKFWVQYSSGFVKLVRQKKPWSNIS